MSSETDHVEVKFDVDDIELAEGELEKTLKDLTAFVSAKSYTPDKWILVIPKICEFVENMKGASAKISGVDKKRLTLFLFNHVTEKIFHMDKDEFEKIENSADHAIDVIISVSKGIFSINVKQITSKVTSCFNCFKSK